jgi:hypothetical protein
LRKDGKRLKAQQMKFLRPLVGASTRNGAHNEVFRKQLLETSVMKNIENTDYNGEMLGKHGR